MAAWFFISMTKAEAQDLCLQTGAHLELMVREEYTENAIICGSVGQITKIRLNRSRPAGYKPPKDLILLYQMENGMVELV